MSSIMSIYTSSNRLIKSLPFAFSCGSAFYLEVNSFSSSFLISSKKSRNDFGGSFTPLRERVQNNIVFSAPGSGDPYFQIRLIDCLSVEMQLDLKLF